MLLKYSSVPGIKPCVMKLRLNSNKMTISWIKRNGRRRMIGPKNRDREAR